MNDYNYDTLKEISKIRGGRVGDLLALAPKNDPFYTGSPATVTAARWFMDVWQQAGYTTGVHLRRVHYWLTSHPVKLPAPLTSKNKTTNKIETFTTYENTERCWTWLVEAGKYARYLGYLSPDAFVDRKHPKAIIYDEPPQDEPNPAAYLTRWEAPAITLPDPPQLVAAGYDGVEQAYSVEIWAEKTTMNDVLEPLCKRYGLNLITGAGELSITAVRDLLRRVRKPTRILYVSDFDPAGMGMPVSVARKIEFYIRQMNGSAPDIALHPVILTAEQVNAYNLPRIPVKDSDLRKGNFEAIHGEAVELDALEALHPGELARILQAAILQYIDADLQQAVNEAERDYQADLDAATQAIHARHARELDALRREYAEIAPLFESIRERVESLYNRLDDELSAAAAEIEPADLPEPYAPGDRGALLYESARDYFTQLQAYKSHRNGE